MIEALEEYSSEHPESIEELKAMHWKLFEGMYEAHAKRRATERCLRVKEAMIAGIWGNTNMDPQKEGDPGARERVLNDVNQQFDAVIDEIWEHKGEMKDEIDQDNPFFGAMNVPGIDPGETAPEIAKRKDGYDMDYDQN